MASATSTSRFSSMLRMKSIMRLLLRFISTVELCRLQAAAEWEFPTCGIPRIEIARGCASYTALATISAYRGTQMPWPLSRLTDCANKLVGREDDDRSLEVHCQPRSRNQKPT